MKGVISLIGFHPWITLTFYLFNMEKTITNGYYQLPNEQWLHFSTNCWYNLQHNTGKSVTAWFEEYEELTKKNDILGRYNLLAELAFAAARAYDQEEDNEIDYNFFKVRNWMSEVKAEDALDLFKAVSWNANLPDSGKKQEGSKETPTKK